MIRFIKRSEKVDTEEMMAQAKATIKQVQEQQPRVNYLTSWLDARAEQNGFGEDFDFSLTPKRPKEA